MNDCKQVAQLRGVSRRKNSKTAQSRISIKSPGPCKWLIMQCLVGFYLAIQWTLCSCAYGIACTCTVWPNGDVFSRHGSSWWFFSLHCLLQTIEMLTQSVSSADRFGDTLILQHWWITSAHGHMLEMSVSVSPGACWYLVWIVYLFVFLWLVGFLLQGYYGFDIY